MQKKFFNTFDIHSIKVSNCSFKNLMKHGIEYGTDVCEAVDNPELECKDCEYSKETVELYPIINCDVLVDLIIIACKYGFSVEKKNEYFSIGDIKEKEFIDLVLRYFIENKDKFYVDVRELFNE